MHTHSISLSSGTEKSQYYASMSAMFDPGWTKASEVERYTANLNATYNIFDNLTLNLISSGSTVSKRLRVRWPRRPTWYSAR